MQIWWSQPADFLRCTRSSFSFDVLKLRLSCSTKSRYPVWWFFPLLFLRCNFLQKVLSKRRTYKKGQAFHIEVTVRLNALTHEKPSLSFRYQIYEWECNIRTTRSCLSSRHRINAITQSFRDTIEFAHNAFYTFRSHSRDSSSFRIIGGNDRDVETWKKERAT